MKKKFSKSSSSILTNTPNSDNYSDIHNNFSKNINLIDLQPASYDIWDKKYRLKNKKGEAVDVTLDDTFKRIALALSDVELTNNSHNSKTIPKDSSNSNFKLIDKKSDKAKKDFWYKEFLWALRNGAIPAGRITSNAGAWGYKPATSLINCTVSEHIHDSMDDIMKKAHDAALTLKAGSGIGYCFSTLRPRHAFVAGAGAYTSGPLSFMDIFDKMCFTVSSAGGRRGAQMATFDVSHPDVIDFIKAKREDGRLRQFNLSLLITDDFMKAVKNDELWALVFPVHPKEADEIDLHDPDKVIWKEWEIKDKYIVREDGLVACKVYKKIKAKHLWNMIMNSTYDYAEPGFILIDKANEMNNNWWCENFRATNPCVTSDTWIQTTVGPRQVKDLIGKQFSALVNGAEHISGEVQLNFDPYQLNQSQQDSLNQDSLNKVPQITTGFFYTGKKEVCEIKTNEGFSLKVTPNHKIRRILDEQYDLDSIFNIDDTNIEMYTEWCATQDLQQGDKILLNNHSKNNTWNFDDNLACNKLAYNELIYNDNESYNENQKNNQPDNNSSATSSIAKINEEFGVTDWGSGYLAGCLLKEITNTTMLDIFYIFESFSKNIDCVKEKVFVKAGSNSFKSNSFNYSSYLKNLFSIFNIRSNLISKQTEKASSEFYLGFLSSIFDKKGYVKIIQHKTKEVSAESHDFSDQTLSDTSSIQLSEESCIVKLEKVELSNLKIIQRMLLRLGIHSKIFKSKINLVKTRNKKSINNVNHVDFELLVSKNSFKTFDKLISFSNFKKNDLFKEYLSKNIYSNTALKLKTFFYATFKDLKFLNSENVYDVSIPSIHTFDANGIMAHNCGEQVLPEAGACLLGSINLTNFVENAFTEKAEFDFEKYKKVIRVFTRMLDNVVELNGLPLEKQRQEIINKRRHGMGFLGLGSTLCMLRVKYGSKEAVWFTEEVTKIMALEGWKEALELSLEKGPAPIMLESFVVTEEMLRKKPEMALDGYKTGDPILGSVLHAKYSKYMQKISTLDPELVHKLSAVGARFTHHSSIAPTGTISLSIGNNVSNGIEPSFSHQYSRNVIREGKKSKEKVDVLSYEFLLYKNIIDENADPFKLPSYFITADTVTPKEHVDIQAASQKWIDSSISKTANIPTDYPYEDFKDIYLYAYEQGLKGCTTFRFNPAAFQGVLVKEQDLINTKYQFTLEDGEIIEVSGNEEILYDGETHTAANLFDALKEGYYGKF